MGGDTRSGQDPEGTGRTVAFGQGTVPGSSMALPVQLVPFWHLMLSSRPVSRTPRMVNRCSLHVASVLSFIVGLCTRRAPSFSPVDVASASPYGAQTRQIIDVLSHSSSGRVGLSAPNIAFLPSSMRS